MDSLDFEVIMNYSVSLTWHEILLTNGMFDAKASMKSASNEGDVL